MNGLKDRVKKQADALSQEQDLLLAEQKLEELTSEVLQAHERLETATHLEKRLAISLFVCP